MIDVAAAVIENREGRILIARRKPEITLGGYWEFPGGKIESGESPAECAARELREEMDIHIDAGGDHCRDRVRLRGSGGASHRRARNHARRAYLPPRSRRHSLGNAARDGRLPFCPGRRGRSSRCSSGNTSARTIRESGSRAFKAFRAFAMRRRASMSVRLRYFGRIDLSLPLTPYSYFYETPFPHDSRRGARDKMGPYRY